jgi:hypothetical protein
MTLSDQLHNATTHPEDVRKEKTLPTRHTPPHHTFEKHTSLDQVQGLKPGEGPPSLSSQVADDYRERPVVREKSVS